MTSYQTRTIVAGDIKTHFLDAGSGPDLVLLHGGEYGASAEITWRANIDILARRFHVVAPDLLGWEKPISFTAFRIPRGCVSGIFKDFWKRSASARLSSSAIPPVAV